ncbi:hypothetical protein OEZ85_000781 [Tetradesmus obliquus]|uniref:Uncharacterized protein n=1 Tax=Tetradesmus obliquus TaxID=3088 RepID=A0ABY8ULN6_TETOB|nr:hypothetical protein OEZ85_000781 [Tetradesmus obliquus]
MPSKQSSSEFLLPWEQQNRRQKRKQQHSDSADVVQYVKYGAGIAAGITVVGWIKRKIQGIPVVGILATPFLCLMPTVLLGTAVGAAVVYGIDEGDPMAAQKKVLPKVHKRLKAASTEVAAVATDLGRSLKDIHGQHLAAAEMAAREGQVAIARMASSLDAAAAEAEATLAPAVERHVKLAKKQLDRHAGEYNGWLQQQQQQQQQQHGRSSQLLLSGTSSDE